MKNLPQFDSELAQSIEYIFSSDIAKKALENPPFSNFANVMRDTIVAIDRLSDNCHMPEFTNHALPHICSVIKRASEWGVNDGWLNKINNSEAGCLLLALIIHDIGMLSQDASNLPDDKFISSRKGLSDISNWTRATHVDRLQKLFQSTLFENKHINKQNEKYIHLIIAMAKTHSTWPSDSKFSENLKVFTGIDKKKIKSLCAVIAVVDLLDEDSNRCDTKTLITHKHGDAKNIAHWIRHTLTINVGEIRDNKLTITTAHLIDTPEGFDNVFKALENHYKLTKLYNEKLSYVGAKINEIEIKKDKSISYDEFAFWDKHTEFKRGLIVKSLLATFMFEAMGMPSRNVSESELHLAGIELIDNIKPTLQQSMMTVEEITLIETNNFEYLREKVERAYLDGNIGAVRHLCSFALEQMVRGNVSADDSYWIPTYLLKFLNKDWEISSLKRTLITLKFIEDDLFSGFSRSRTTLKGINEYYTLISIIIKIFDNKIASEKIRDYSKEILEMLGVCFVETLSTSILIETIIEIIWYLDSEDNEWLNITDHFISIYKNKKFDYNFLAKLKKRIIRQNNILNDKNIKAEYVINDTVENNIATAWNCFFNAEWKMLEISLNQLSSKVKYGHEYFIPLQGLYNMNWLSITLEKGVFEQVSSSNYYKYQRLIQENSLRVFEVEREAYVKTLLHNILYEPNNAATSRKELIRAIMLLKLVAYKYWDLGLLISTRRYSAELCESLALYFDKDNKYCGLTDFCANAIICNIESLTADVKKINNKEKYVMLINIIDVHCPSEIDKVYKYIFEESKPIEWTYVWKWLEFLEDRLPKNMVDEFICWLKKFSNYVKTLKTSWDSHTFDFLIDILENYKFTKKQWNRLYPIIDDIVYNKFYIHQSDLYESILCSVPKEKCQEIIETIKLWRGDENIIYYVAKHIFNSAVKRKDISKIAVIALDEIHNSTLNNTYKQWSEWLEVRRIDKQTEVRFDEINIRIESFMKSLKDNIDSQKSGIQKFSVHDTSGTTTVLQNTNWKLVSKDEKDLLFGIITSFIEENNGALDKSYFYDLVKILKAFVIGCDKKYKLKAVTFVIELIKSNYSTVNHIHFDGDNPLQENRFNINNGDLSMGCLMILAEFISIVDKPTQIFISEWLIENMRVLFQNNAYYYNYLCSYLCMLGDENIRIKMTIVVNALRISNNNVAVKNDLAQGDTIKSIYHLSNHITQWKMNFANKMSSVKGYEDYVFSVLEKCSLALNKDTRLFTAKLIKKLLNSVEYSNNEKLIGFSNKMKSERSMSIIKIFEN